MHAQVALSLVDAAEHRLALRYLDRAIALDPQKSEYRAARGVVHQSLGSEAAAVADYRAALARGVRSIRVLNNLGWLLAAGDDPKLRAPAEALALAQEAVQRSGSRDPKVLDTLATAQAAAGRDAEALETANRALELAEAQQRRDLAESIRQRFPALSRRPASTSPDAGAGA